MNKYASILIGFVFLSVVASSLAFANTGADILVTQESTLDESDVTEEIVSEVEKSADVQKRIGMHRMTFGQATFVSQDKAAIGNIAWGVQAFEFTRGTETKRKVASSGKLKIGQYTFKLMPKTELSAEDTERSLKFDVYKGDNDVGDLELNLVKEYSGLNENVKVRTWEGTLTSSEGNLRGTIEATTETRTFNQEKVESIKERKEVNDEDRKAHLEAESKTEVETETRADLNDDDRPFWKRWFVKTRAEGTTDASG